MYGHVPLPMLATRKIKLHSKLFKMLKLTFKVIYSLHQINSLPFNINYFQKINSTQTQTK